jgi:hypothetical protein
MRPRIRPLYLALGFCPACQLSQADTSSFTTAVVVLTSVSESTSDGAGTTDDAPGSESSTTADLSTTTDPSTGAAASDSGGTTLILDVAADHDLGDGKPIGCKGKIDFLFVISRYGGMEGFQTQLLDAFPQFIDTIEAKFSDFDYHIMVIDGDATWGHEACNEKCPSPCFAGYPCGYTPTYCDTKLGAGTVFPAGYDAANEPCNIDIDRRYMKTGQTDLKEAFACSAQIGSSSSRAWLGEALAAAMHSNINDPGGCNPGFLRDDALLMVTLISNTYDLTEKPWGSTGTPETWTAAVREAKGDLESVVLLNIGDTMVPGCHENDRLCQMVELFPHALNTEVWADDYGPFFDEATDLVETACAEFVPPQ